jgi:hypothetical protein
MKFSKRLATLTMASSLVLTSVSSEALAASPPDPGNLSPVGSANPKVAGFAQPNGISLELDNALLAQGANQLENGVPAVQKFGYDNNGPELPSPSAPTTEATKTEPDKNVYLVQIGSLPGADPSYNYGTHFLFQGHEAGTPGYVTRVNLDADPAHRTTLLATTDSSGANLPTFDGITWNPFAQRLLLTSELGSAGGVWQATLQVPARAINLQPFIGRAGFENVQNDSAGNVWLLEDVGGDTGTGANANAKRPNSFVYRFVPNDIHDLTRGGSMQALQVMDTQGVPITFRADQTADQAIFTDGNRTLHSCGLSLDTRWITLFATDSTATGTGPDDNAVAKALGATPFNRMENGQFRPGSRFDEFLFDETGDTNADSSANAQFGGWGTVQKLSQRSPTSDTGELSLFYYGNEAHSGFDNVAFFDRNHASFVEDAGDTLHSQRNALDSAFMFDVTQNYCRSSNQPTRWLAEGRDASATIDSALKGQSGFVNSGDNEITGLHVSDGDPSERGLLGAKFRTPGGATGECSGPSSTATTASGK